MAQLFVFISNVLRRYTPAQRFVLIVVFIGLLSVTVSLVLWANRPEFVVLYSELDPTNASQMVGELQSQKIPYKIKDGGKTVMVPEEDAAELRLRFVDAGYVGQPVAGYELFDDQKLGMTTFMQQLNMRRALEGEITKTINQFPGVRNSRVHLVIPEDRLFESDGEASASVVIDLVNGRFMADEQVKGIAALVANSVEGLEADGVVVVDTKGNLLSSAQGEEAVMGSTGNKWDMRNTIERKLENKVNDILAGIVGPRNAVVEVSVQMNFEKVQRTSESFDPENVVVISEERHSESSTNQDSTRNASVQHQNEDIITNYELNKSTEQYVSDTGIITHQSVAVLVNGTTRESVNEEGETVSEYVPRTAREIAQITALVRSAVGYSEERGDVVEVQNVRFDNSLLEEDRAYFEHSETMAVRATLINRGLLIAGLLVAFLIVRGLLKSLSSTIELPTLTGGGSLAAALPASGGGHPTGLPGQGIPPGNLSEGHYPEGYEPPPEILDYEVNEDAYIKKLSPEARAKLKAKDRMTEEVVSFSKDSPDDTAKLMRTWLTNTRG